MAVCSEIRTIIHCIQNLGPLFLKVLGNLVHVLRIYNTQQQVLRIPETAMKVNEHGAVKLYNILVVMKFPVSRSVGGFRIILRLNYYDREGKEAQNCSNTADPQYC